jgi:hypothetical protein
MNGSLDDCPVEPDFGPALRHITLAEFFGQKINQRAHRRQQSAP